MMASEQSLFEVCPIIAEHSFHFDGGETLLRLAMRMAASSLLRGKVESRTTSGLEIATAKLDQKDRYEVRHDATKSRPRLFV